MWKPFLAASLALLATTVHAGDVGLVGASSPVLLTVPAGQSAELELTVVNNGAEAIAYAQFGSEFSFWNQGKWTLTSLTPACSDFHSVAVVEFDQRHWLSCRESRAGRTPRVPVAGASSRGLAE